MKFNIDLHVHTKYSGDNEAEPEEEIIRALELGLQGLAFTEHYFYEASEPVEILKEKYAGRILIFRGVEFSSAEGHCLVYGANTDKLSIKYTPMRDVIRVVNRAGGVVIPSHPYRSVNSIGDGVFDVEGICALEGYNGCNMHPFNAKAVEVAGSLNLPYTGGSDAHASHEVGSCYTAFNTAVTVENLVSLLKGGEYRGVDMRKISKMGKIR